MEVANSDLLDDEIHSNFSFLGIGKPSAKQQAKRDAKSTATGGCYKPKKINKVLGANFGNFAVLNKNKKDMTAYKKCLEDTKIRIESQASASQGESHAKEVADLKSKLDEAEKNLHEVESGKSSAPIDEVEKKFLGMPQTTGIIVTILGASLLAVGTVLTIRHFRS